MIHSWDLHFVVFFFPTRNFILYEKDPVSLWIVQTLRTDFSAQMSTGFDLNGRGYNMI